MSIHGFPPGSLPVSPSGGTGTPPAADVPPPGQVRLPPSPSGLSLRVQHPGPGLQAAVAPRNARLPTPPVRHAAMRTASPQGSGAGPGATDPAGAAGHPPPPDAGLPTCEPGGPHAAPSGPPGDTDIPPALRMQQQMQDQMNQQMAWQMQMQFFTAKQQLLQKLGEAVTSSMKSFGEAIHRAVG